MRHLLALILALFSLPATAQQVGTLIAADPVADPPVAMHAWRIRYWTSGGDGTVREATGMVVAPSQAAPTASRRVIAWTHGAWGVAERCAPSLSASFFAASAGVEPSVRQGYVVVASDYIGLGSPTVHPFLVGEDTARSVLDAVRAAQGIAGAGAGKRFAVWGESQGGHAALWTATRAGAYAPDLTLVGAAAAAPPTDLAANLRSGSDKNARALLLSFALHSWSSLYGFSLDPIANRTNQGIIHRLAENNCVTLGKKPKLGTILGIVTVARATRNKDIGRIEPWASWVRTNSVDPARVPGPLLIAQGDKDTIVAPAITRAFATGLCRNRTSLKWIDMRGTDHADSARDSTAETLAWIGDRFAGAPPPDDCGKF